MDATSRETLVRTYWDRVWGRAEFHVVDDVFAEWIIRHNRSGSTLVSREQLKADLAQYFRSIPNPRPVVHEINVTGDKVWSRATVFGRSEEARVVVSFLHLARVADGRIAETWSLAAPDVDWSEPIPQQR